jgi:energy-coupling factor transporter ATP-binding protein EcfA2
MSDDAGFTVAEAPDDPPPGKGKRPRRRDVLATTLSGCALWRSPDGIGHASVPMGGKRYEHMRCESKSFREWLTLSYLRLTGSGISGTALAEVVNLAVARALDSGETRRPWRRVALGDDGAVWWDLGGGDPAGERRAVRITAEGWRVVAAKDVEPAFLRAPDALPLPEPEAGEATAATFAEVMNLEPDSDDLALLLGWIVCALRPFAEGGGYPIAFLHGEQGSGKSSLARMVQALIDPSSLTGRALPREERDLFVTAGNRHLLGFDNVSGIGDAFSDSFCRLATGGGFSGRTLHTDADETIFVACRPLLLNGIPATILSRPDLAERALAIELRPIRARRTDGELAARFTELRPALLGLVCDGLASALRNLGRVTLADPPRMMDAATWAEAAAEGLGIAPGRIARAWSENRRRAEAEALATDDLAGAVVAFLGERGGTWRGGPSELLRELRNHVSETVAKSSTWPRSAAALSGRLRRLAPGLRRVKRIEFAAGKAGSDGARFLSLARIEPEP